MLAEAAVSVGVTQSCGEVRRETVYVNTEKLSFSPQIVGRCFGCDRIEDDRTRPMRVELGWPAMEWSNPYM